jgi:PAS domain-containing protein
LIRDNEKNEFQEIIGKTIETPNKVFGFDQKHRMQKLNWEYSVFNNEEGDFLGVLGIATLQDETEIIIGTENFKLNPKIDIAFQLNGEWEIQSANEIAEGFFGKKIKYLLNQKIWQVFQHPKIYEYALEFKKAKETNCSVTFDDYNPESDTWHQVVIYPKNDCLDIYFKDISTVHGLASKKNLMKSTLDAILENSDEGFFLMNNELKIKGFNTQASELVMAVFNKELKENEKFVNLLMPGTEEKFLMNIEEIFSGSIISFEEKVEYQSIENSRLLRHTFIPVPDDKKKVASIIYRVKDIQEEKDNLSKSIQNNELLRNIIYNQNNVLRSPLSSILGLLDLIDDKQLNEDNQKYFSYLKPLAEELDKVIRNNTKKMNESDSFLG